MEHTRPILGLIARISKLSDTEHADRKAGKPGHQSESRRALIQESVDQYFEMRNADPEGTITLSGDTEVRLALLVLHPYSEEVLALFNQQRAESFGSRDLKKLSEINHKIDLLLATHPAHGGWKGPRS